MLNKIAITLIVVVSSYIYIMFMYNYKTVTATESESLCNGSCVYVEKKQTNVINLNGNIIKQNIEIIKTKQSLKKGVVSI